MRREPPAMRHDRSWRAAAMRRDRGRRSTQPAHHPRAPIRDRRPMRAERTISTSGATKSSSRPVDRAIAELAEHQHGVVALAQLGERGLGASGVRARVDAGRLHRIHSGVYAVGHPVLGREGRWMAAVLACGRGAVLSHRPAGALWGLRRWAGRAEVLVPPGARPRRPGIIARRSELSAAEITRGGAIPCTSPSRTLLDLATVLRQPELERAVERAELLRLLDLKAVRHLLARRRGCRGVARLRAALAAYTDEHEFTRSGLEREFLRFCRRSGLPTPVVNATVPVAGRTLEVDFTWPERRVAVEADGYETHRTRAAFERDRRREQLLGGAGWTTIRCTWRQVASGSSELHRALARALALGPPPRAERTISPP
jgi:very-short-patch-repair endonuclease